MVKFAGGIFELGLAYLVNDCVDEAEKFLYLLMREHDCVVHDLIVYLVCACLDHNDLFHGGGNRELEVGHLLLLGRGVDDILTVDKTDVETADRSVPRDIGDSEGGRCAYHSRNLGSAIGINAHDRECERDVVAEVLREERSYGTVDNAAGENCLFAGLSFSLEVSAGNLTCGVHSLVEVDREGKEVDTVTGLFRCGSAAENCGLAVANEDRTVCKSCHFTCLDNERSACKCVLEGLEILELHLGAYDCCGHFYFLRFLYLHRSFRT